MNKEAVNGQSTNEARLLTPTLAMTEATVTQLQELVQSTIRAENQAGAVRAEAVAELRRREGEELAEAVLREKAAMAGRGSSESVHSGPADGRRFGDPPHP